MIRSFSPSEVNIMLSLPGSKTAVANKIAYLARCKSNFAKIVTLVRRAFQLQRGKHMRHGSNTSRLAPNIQHFIY
jgi:hypothetical protein